MCETNEDGKYDPMGSFYGNIVNLSAELQEEESERITNMNETVVIEKPNDELIVTILQDTNEEDEDEEDIEQDHKWDKIRSPTPPKSSPKIEPAESVENNEEHHHHEVSMPLFKSILEEDHKTPTPPQLMTMKSRALFMPIQDMNATFDLNQDDVKADDEQNSTFNKEETNEVFEEMNVNSTIILSPKVDQEPTEVINSTIVINQEPIEEASETNANSTIIISTASDNVDQGASPVLKIAKVAPMAVEKVKTNSVPLVNRRVPPLSNSRRPLMRTGTKSSSNLIKAVEKLTLPIASHEAPADLRTPMELNNIPSYLKPTTASSRKFKGSSTSTPSRSPSSQSSNENVGTQRTRVTGISAKQQHQQHRPARKDAAATTLKPINK